MLHLPLKTVTAATPTYRSGRGKSQSHRRAGIGQKQSAGMREVLEGHVVGLAEKYLPAPTNGFAWLEVTQELLVQNRITPPLGDIFCLTWSVKFLVISTEASHRYGGRGIPGHLRITN